MIGNQFLLKSDEVDFYWESKNTLHNSSML